MMQGAEPSYPALDEHAPPVRVAWPLMAFWAFSSFGETVSSAAEVCQPHDYQSISEHHRD